MTIIQVKTADQVLSAVLVPKLAPHNQNSVKLTVDFDSAWDGYGKSAVFYKKDSQTMYKRPLDSADSCMVPAEVLAEPGYLFIVIEGVKTSDNSVKSSARMKLKISEGMPLFVVSEPTEDVYKQLLAAYSRTNEAIAVERAKIDSLATLDGGSTTGDAELILARTDFSGKTHANLQTAINTHIKKLTRGRFALGALLPSGVLAYPSISTKNKTFTVGEDTLLINDRIPGGIVSLVSGNGNNTVTWGDEITSSAICFYYDISNNVLVARSYTDFSDSDNLVLLATLRNRGNAQAICSCPIYVDGKLSTEVTEAYNIEDAVKRENTNIKTVNHRGYNTLAPENTLSAFRLSKKNGFTHVECDVSFTSDGVAVLLHDSTVDRTSNGTGSIANLTLEAVRSLDFGSWKSEDYAGEKIPTFEEFIALCKHLGLHPYIELKTGTEAQIKGLVEVVKRYGMKGKVTWISFSAACLGYVKAVDPKARLGFVADAVSATTINTIQKTLQSGHNEVFVDCAHGNASAAVQLCMDADIPLEVWTLNIESALFALDPYVSGVTSDNLIAGSVFYDNNIGG